MALKAQYLSSKFAFCCRSIDIKYADFRLLEKAGNWVDQKIEELPAEEQEAAEMKLMATADALVDTLDKAYTVTEKACDSIIDSLDELEKWLDKW